MVARGEPPLVATHSTATPTADIALNTVDGAVLVLGYVEHGIPPC